MIRIILIGMIIVLNATGCVNNNNQAQENEAATPPPAVSEVPKPTEAPKTESVIAEFKTPIKDARKARLQNIQLSINAINKATIKSGEVFSFNDIVGPRTKERGYKKAIVFEKGEKIMGYGGGICQVSTVIYNAAMQAGLEIIERHEHQEPVNYIEKGKDATVNYDTADLKIKNTKPYSININVIKNAKSIDAKIIMTK